MEQSEKFKIKGVANIGDEQDHFIEFEGVYNEALNELHYLITWDEKSQFVMALDSETSRLKIQGPAPYAARESEETIEAAIDCYNNGFYWV